MNVDVPADTGQNLAGQLREKPIIRDAAVLDGPEPDGLTAMVVRQGYRPGPVFRDLVMRLAGERCGTIGVAIVPEIPRDAEGVVDQGAAREILRQRSLILHYEPPASDSERRPISQGKGWLPAPKVEQGARESEHRAGVAPLRLDAHRRAIFPDWQPGLARRKAGVAGTIPSHRRSLGVPALAGAGHV